MTTPLRIVPIDVPVIRNAEEFARYSRAMEYLVSVIQALSMARELDSIMAIVREAAREITGADGATFVLRDGDFCYYAEENAIEPLWKGRHFPIESCVSGWAMLHREAVVIEDIYQDDRIPIDAYRPTFVKSLVMVPIRTHNPLGAIGNYWAENRMPTPMEVKWLQALADTTAVAIENVQLYGELEDKVEQRTVQLKAVNWELKKEVRVRQKAEETLQGLYDTLQSEFQERKRLESQLIHAQKMESVGQLAAGIAHEINNPIGYVMSNLGTLAKYVVTFKRLLSHYQQMAVLSSSEASQWQGQVEALEAICSPKRLAYIEDDVDKLIQESLGGIERVRDIVKNLRVFSRVDEECVKEADINECIESTLKIVWNELKYKCTVHRNYGDLPLIRCNPGHLNQVFMNLLVNAAQAIEQDGDITIETRLQGSDVIIEIGDTGAGIASEHLSQIFNPFFTTKPVGMGTGLGLSISYDIIQQHRGDITVNSQPGQTVFTITLPINALPMVDAPEPVSLPSEEESLSA